MSESRIAEQVGRVLGGRYRLIAPIGIGSSGEVYLADDTQLRRQVAVKVLHRVLADDDVFLRRFRDEAQMAASLSHSNIVAVHDWGEDDVPFLVTEYLGGGSLRTMLDEAGPLTPSQALLIGLEATRGLEYAHRRGVVQRDIKPGNLLFDSDAHLRIADFGLAKALAEASATEPTGAILGTVRYASPEQAQGQRVDAKSDVYSLALVLVEVISGSLPFDSDTTIGTLMARVEQPLRLGDEFGPLRATLERAGSLDPADRPDAGELHVRLMAAAEDMSRPEPLPLAGAMSFDPVSAVDHDPTMVGVAAGAPADAGDGTKKRRGRRKASSPRRAAPAVEKKQRRRWPWMLMMMVLIAGVGTGAYVALSTNDPATQMTPNVVGLTPGELRAEVADFWQLEEALDRADGSTPGTILRTDPLPGTELVEGELLTYWVSQGNELKVVPPNLVGLTVADAETFLIGAGLVLGETGERNDEEAEAGIVIEVAEPSLELPGGEGVDLVVSSGPRIRQVPDGLVGLTYVEAESQLAVERLEAARVDAFDNTVPTDLVISVSPPPGSELDRGAVVELTVSLGPQPITVPSVSGQGLSVAVDQLKDAGLCIGETDGPADTQVIATDPPAGSEVFVGTCVRIVTSQVGG